MKTTLHNLSAELLERPTLEQLQKLGSKAVLLVRGPKAALSKASKLFEEANFAEQGELTVERLIEAMMPTRAVPEPVVVLQARRNAALRESLLEEFGALTAEQVHEFAGSVAGNKSALAGKWRKGGEVFAVEHRGKLYYPAFQFADDGRPRPVVARVIKLFGQDGPGWQTALWLIGANGWLGGKRPVDLLAVDPDKVEYAAAAEVASVG